MTRDNRFISSYYFDELDKREIFLCIATGSKGIGRMQSLFGPELAEIITFV